MQSSLTLMLSLVGATCLFGCDDIIGSKPDQGSAASDPALAAPPALNVREQKTQPKAPAKSRNDIPISSSTDRAPAEDIDDDEKVDEPAPKKKRAKKDDDDRSESDDGEKEKDLNAHLTVNRFVIAKGVKGREPVGAANVFTEGAQKKIYAFVEVGNGDQVPSELYVTFRNHKTGKTARVPVQVGAGARWRTWVFTRAANKPGKWSASVKNAKGKTLASGNFTIEAAKKGSSKAKSEDEKKTSGKATKKSAKKSTKKTPAKKSTKKTPAKKSTKKAPAKKSTKKTPAKKAAPAAKKPKSDAKKK